MRSFLASLVVAVALGQQALSVSVWGQCGGSTYTGSTTCDSGSSCVVVNDYYYQCQPGTASGGTPTTVNPTTTATSGGSTALTCSNRTKFKYFGVNESGAEFGNTAWPGTLGKDYTWPSPSSVDYFVGKGFNTFRVAFLLERMFPPSTGLTGSPNSTYLAGLQSIVSYATGKGAYVLIEPHNFMRYNNGVISSTSDFAAMWRTLSGYFKSNANVIFDLMNEPHDIAASTVFNLEQAAVTSIRAGGATSQMIMLEGTSYTGAWTWTSSGNSDAFKTVNDPNKNTVIQMHQYLDSDGSGTSSTCVSATIGAERLASATAWLKATGNKGFLGEIGAASNPTCISAVYGAMCAMQQAGGVWIGALWWAAGPWWADYIYSIEPTAGAAILSMLPQALLPFL